MTSSSGAASSRAATRKALSKIACNRLQKELMEWQVNPLAGFKHKVTDNLERWIIEVVGAPGTLYANESYGANKLPPPAVRGLRASARKLHLQGRHRGALCRV